MPQPLQLRGETMGTTYHVTYVPAAAEVEQKDIDDLLHDINQSLSTYIPTSIISTINTSTDVSRWHPIDAHFETVFQRSVEIHKDSVGAFNPAVGPLVSAWGFGPDGPRELPSDAQIQTLLQLAKFEAFQLRPSPPSVQKSFAGAQLDFNAIAKGYGVDAVGELLERKGVTNYLVEIGGEVRARGHRDSGPWRIGIERPSADAGDSTPLQLVIPLEDRGMATSGNTRNYRLEDDGKRYSHILDPKTGYPEQSLLLSVSVIAKDSMTADAYATALMVMGMEKGLAFVESRQGLEAYFISSDGNGGFIEKHSKGFPAGLP